MMRQLIITVALVFASAVAAAGDPAIYSHKKSGAVKGADVVAYFSLEQGQPAVKGLDSITHEYMGATWKFSSEENRAKFVANPEKYAPQYGGYCAFAVSHNFTKPINPDAWRVVDDKLYLNLSKGVRKKWLKDVPGNISRADSNWPNVLK